MAEIQTESTKHNTLLWLILGVIGSAAAFYLYTLPQIRELKLLRTQSATLEADLSSLNEKKTTVVKLNDDLKRSTALTDKLALAVPEDEAIDELITSLEKIVEKAGITLLSVQPASNVETGKTTAMLSTRGSYSGTTLFLEFLEKNLRPIGVNDLALTATSDIQGASLISASFEITPAQIAKAAPAAETSAQDTETKGAQ